MNSGKVRALEWKLEEPNWWVSDLTDFNFGYEVRVTERGQVRTRRANEPFSTFEGSAHEAKAFFQADFERRILGCLQDEVV